MAAGTAAFKVGSAIGNALKPVSNWIAGLKWGNVFKGGLFAGAAGSVVLWWNNSIQTVADATGLTTGQVSTCIYLIVGVFILYLIYRIAKWRNDRASIRNTPIVQRFKPKTKKKPSRGGH